MRYFLSFLAGLIGLVQGLAQHPWQQAVKYEMDIRLDPSEHRMEGKQILTYYNNSPDTLHQVFYHLYFNAFQPGSMMDQRSQALPDPDKRIGDRIAKLKKEEIGFHQVLSLQQNGKGLYFVVQGTILQAQLKEALLPGDSAVFEMRFTSQVPVQIRRSGRNNAEGIDYTMTQWYPKIAAYDHRGWHPDPYVAREFYAPFGDFSVRITLPGDYRLGATGVLQEPSKFWRVSDTLEEGALRMQYLSTDDEERSWHFVANRVHDFAWAADTEYEHLIYPAHDSLDLHFYFLDQYADTWLRLPAYTKRFFLEMNQRFGAYPYPQFSVIQGGDGGMEYPMCTMLKGTGKLPGLIGVMAHESAHSWFYGVLASNENDYPWLDEGFTSFAEDEVLNSFRPEPQTNPHQRAYRLHAYYLSQEERSEPLSTPADAYRKNRSYGINSYARGQVFLAQLRYILGDTLFQKGMLRYYREWSFRHPAPEDFLRIMEKTSGLQLDWYLAYWVHSLKPIDYGIAEVRALKGGTAVTLENLGEMPMPLRLRLVLRNGAEVDYYLPLVGMFGAPPGQQNLTPWPWTQERYTFNLPYALKEIESLQIDPEGYLADLNPANNQYPREEGQE